MTVSIHAPARGATVRRAAFDEGGLGVSIHAPARGATFRGKGRWRGSGGFNPRAREGRDYGGAALTSAPFTFQSTRPRGARRIAGKVAHLPKTFQSTRPRGARQSQRSHRDFGSTVSIHAPARGATSDTTTAGTQIGSFNPRAREGRDCTAGKLTIGVGSFNPRAREGRDIFPNQAVVWGQPVSIHAPARGATTL